MKKTINSILLILISLFLGNCPDPKPQDPIPLIGLLFNASALRGGGGSGTGIGTGTGTNTGTGTGVTRPSNIFNFGGSFIVGISRTPMTTTVNGCSNTVCTYSISPSLPSGITMDSANGTISGIATSVSSSTNYFITVSNSAGSATSSFATSISTLAMTVSYPTTFIAYYPVNTAVSMTPTVSSASTVTYNQTGTLPAGVTFNTTTGVFGGTTPGAATTTSFTVTATNSAGTVTIFSSASFRVATVANMTCNTSGIASGCSASFPFSCNNSLSSCYGTYSACVATAPNNPCQF